MTKTRATFTVGTILLVIGALTRFVFPIITDNALIVFTLWNIAGVIAALSEDLTGKYQD